MNASNGVRHKIGLAINYPKVPKSAIYKQLENVAPITVFIKNIIDPLIVVMIIYLLQFVFNVSFDGFYITFLVISALLTLQFVDGLNLFLDDESSSIFSMLKLILEWSIVVVLTYLIEIVSGWENYISYKYQICCAVIIPLVIVFSHWLASRLLLAKINSNDDKRRKAIIVGANASGLKLKNGIQSNRFSHIDVIGFFDDRDISRLENFSENKLLGKLSDIDGFTKENQIDDIYISLPMASQPRVMGLLDQLKDSTVSIYFVPDFFIFNLIQAKFNYIASTPVVCICETPLLGMSAVSKRLLDLIFSLGILSLIWPVMLLVAIAVKTTSKGPILFKQSRYGMDGKSIGVYKFRSMKVLDNGDTVKQATKNDSRLTPIGAFIRKTSLDELPQFLNVLEGSMSIVGPRPHANAHNEYYRKLIKGYMIRHKVKPGITGWAQVNGLRGETETIDKMEKRINYDLDYLRNWSVWLDIKIIFKTILTVIKKDNAY